jgi:Ca-activated chloride channel family protein
MQALDAEVAGRWQTRLELGRRVVARFAERRVAEGDRVALVVFGEQAFTQCPLSSDGRLLAAALDRVTPGMAGGATALGDALALAVKRAAASGARSEPEASEEHRDVARSEPEASEEHGGETAQAGAAPQEAAAGRLVVLLTDGRSNAGAVPPDVAAALARARGVRVHTVGIGGTGEVAMQSGRGLRFERHDLDADTLAAIAAATGGRFFAARSAGDLEAVYEAIDKLERVPRRPPPRRHRSAHAEPFLAGAALLVALELAGTRGLARRIP